MFLPTAFERYKGTVPQGKFALGSDSVSSPRGDSLYVYKMADQQPRRLLIGYSAPSGSVPVYADTYVLDWQTKLWYRFGLQKTLVPGNILNSDLIGSFNELPGTILTDQGEGTYVALVVSDNANAPNGKHVFSLGSDLDLGTFSDDAIRSIDSKIPQWLSGVTPSLVGTTGQVIKSASGRCKRVSVETTETANAEYLLVFDKATAPINGDAPIDFVRIPAIAMNNASPSSIFYGDTGRVFTNGIAFAVSSTLATLTLSLNSRVMVSYEYV